MYGSSGYLEKPQGLVLENFLFRASDVGGKGNSCIKSIVSPRRVYKFEHAHFPIYYQGFYAIDEEGNRQEGAFRTCDQCKLLRINHYFTKSKEEWIKRRSLGKADSKNPNNIRSLDEFYKHDNNDIYDDIGLYYADLVKSKTSIND